MKNTAWHQTKFSEAVGIQYPIIQGPFGGGYSTVELTSTVSNLGGLGSFGAQSLAPQQIIETSNAIRSATDKPYAINLWVSDRDERLASFKEADYEKLINLFKPYFEEFDVPVPEMPTSLGPQYEDQVAALLEARPPAFSFVFGIPSREVLRACRKKGIKTIGNATTLDEAVALEAAGVDAVVATGFEAGGHRVSFLRPAEDSLTGTFSLVPQVADRLNIPVVAAGGIADGRGIAAAMILGAAGVQIGTAFLACSQSNATEQHRQQLFSEAAKYTTLTKVFSGRLARGTRSKLSEAFKAYEKDLAPFPLQGLFLSALRLKMLASNRADLVTCWAGQSSLLIKYKDATELFHSLVSATETLLQPRTSLEL